MDQQPDISGALKTPSQSTSPKSILILSSDTGGGHRSAAKALENSFMNLHPHPGQVLVNIARVLEDSSLICNSMAGVYNYLLRHRQHWMKYYYSAIERFKPNESPMVLKSTVKYGIHLLEKCCPDVIVSVHPMTQHFCANILRKLGLIGKIPLYTVVTDPCAGFWSAWACDDVEQYFVAGESARDELISFGVPAEKITISGMPVHSKFKPVSEAEKMALRDTMGLSPDQFTVFMNAGWIGGGNIPKIFEEMTQAHLDMQVVFLAGNNETLIQNAHELAQSAKFPVKVMGYSNEIENIMNASDVMVSKLGGLTTFEAMACRLPVIADTITPPMPQEAQTVDFIQQTGAGLTLDNPRKIVSVVQSLMGSDQLTRMRHAATQYGQHGAADRIAQQIFNYIASPFENVGATILSPA
ncbi:MAG: glycosyltransferase [Vampirovibrio sp.]|nr:glycosyltransferase [Vampirovibrio sp.]